MTPPSEPMLLAMLDLQDGMNRKINPAWIDAGYPFLRAVMVEATEALDHYGWKWWKAQSPDMPQLRIELVDIWHFLLSHYLVDARGAAGVAAARILGDWVVAGPLAFDGASYAVDRLELREGFELLAALSAVRRVSLPLVAALFRRCDLSAAGLYREYVSKNVLNHFRQDHGYKTGEYRKSWDGREDNEHLAELLGGLDAASGTLAADLYAALKGRYDSLVALGRAR